MAANSTQPSPMAPNRAQDPGKGDSAVGTYKKMEEIGRGSFATVYKAIYLSPQKPRSYVAIKSVNLAKLNKKLKDNLSSEIDILKRLQHPHIVSLIDCKESSAHIHLVMEYCALGDLSYFIKKRDTLAEHDATRDMIAKYPNPRTGGLNEVVVRHFLKQLASALAFLRDRNLIHRDVKPQNLLLNPPPSYYTKDPPSILPYAPTDNSFIPIAGIESLPMLKIADFGFARSLPATSLAETLCGSPLYMAPEILRYEKYDAKADLWSVGTVLFEMVTGKPPFRAANHVELLRKIERNDDKINFPTGPEISDLMKQLIRALLKRGPTERLSFADFFAHPIITEQIPGLVASDRPPEKPRLSSKDEASVDERSPNQSPRLFAVESEPRYDTTQSPLGSPREKPLETRQLQPTRQPTAEQSPESPQRPASIRRITSRDKATTAMYKDQPSSPLSGRRPSIVSHATAPGRQELLERQPVSAVAVERQINRGTSSPVPSLLREQVQEQENKKQNDRTSREERERAAQDVAFERDYVVVEKKAVEVNAFADELAASPRIHGAGHNQLPPQAGAMVRRATTQGAPTSITGAQVTPSRAMQIAQGRPRADVLHHRQGSYERRYGPSPTSATSAISKALNMASGRLFGAGFSPPLNTGKGGRSPPSAYSPFPAYPTSHGSLVVIAEGGKSQVTLDEDSRAVHSIEECATRSDVVYGFAEVKYKQLIPLAPSMQAGGGSRRASLITREQDGNESADEGLTVDAIVTLSEEALVLYVKALALLAKSMDIAGAWWARKNRGEVVGDLSSHRSSSNSTTSPATGNRINSVVQWVRNRFNEVLEKAEFVRLKLLEGQKRLPHEHSSLPSNTSTETSGTTMATSVDHVVVTSGVTAEKLMYDRALEMSRAAAINELTGEDLPGCEIAYVTAVRMLEAILETDEDQMPKKNSDENSWKQSGDPDLSHNGLEAEDRKTVVKLVASMRTRLTGLRKKMAVISKRASTPAMNVPPKAPLALHHHPSVPAIATTPPK